VKPAPFEHMAPADVTEALALLRDRAPDARLLAGGQSLMPMLNYRLARPALLIDLNGIAELAYIRHQGETLAIGAMTRERDIETSELVRGAAPLLHEATIRIGHLAIRNRGTIGGSLANADPAAEYPAVALALDCEMAIRSVRGERLVAAADFFQGPLATAIEPDELLVEIIVPKAPPGSGAAFAEIARRRGDFALAGVAAQVTFAGGSLTGARLAACGVGPGPVRLAAAEQVLLRDGAGLAAVKAAARAAMDEIDPATDIHASAEYRRRLAGIMVLRAVTAALERAGGQG